MKNSLICFCMLFFFESCQKECFEFNWNLPSGSNTPVNTYLPLRTGSYWVYQNLVVDTAGNETLVTNTDTVKIEGDTVINDITYYIFRGLVYTECKACKNILRDSAGCMVSPDGRIFFSAYLRGRIISRDSIPGHQSSFSEMGIKDTSINTPAGIFTSLGVKHSVFFYGNYPWQNPRVTWSFYSDSIGIIKETSFFQPSSSHMEGRLINFHIKN